MCTCVLYLCVVCPVSGLPAIISVRVCSVWCQAHTYSLTGSRVQLCVVNVIGYMGVISISNAAACFMARVPQCVIATISALGKW
jgi:hypothetical protein